MPKLSRSSHSWSAFIGHGILASACVLSVLWGAPTWLWALASASTVASIVFTRKRALPLLLPIILLGLLPATLISVGLRSPLTREYLALYLCVFVVAALGVSRFFQVAKRHFPVSTQSLQFFTTLIAVTLILLELSLRGFGVLSGWPLFQAVDVSAEQRIDANRRLPREIRFGFPCNDQGFYDDPFDSPTAKGFKRVACISDSFGVGVVPHHYNFTTVAERRGSQLRVDNISVVSIGPPEYLHLLETVAKKLSPDAYLLCLFLGNDITDTRRHPRFRMHRPSILERDDFLMWRVPRRILRIRSGLESLPEAEGRIEGNEVIVKTAHGELRIPRDRLVGGYESLYPWLHDQDLEEATFAEEAYLDLCLEKATAICGDRDNYGSIKEVLTEIHKACDEKPLYIALFPDEFQVDDDLWQTMLAMRPETSWNRDRPQDEIITHLEDLGVPHLDLLPILRIEARENPDARSYKLRDTHFNSLGNRIAGEALGAFLEEKLFH